VNPPSLVFRPLWQDYLVVGARFHFRLRHVVDNRMPGSVAPPLVGEEVAQVDAAMRADHMKGYFAIFEEPDQKHTGNAEDAGGGLSGELAVSRDNRDRLARLQVVENDEKQVVKAAGGWGSAGRPSRPVWRLRIGLVGGDRGSGLLGWRGWRWDRLVRWPGLLSVVY